MKTIMLSVALLISQTAIAVEVTVPVKGMVCGLCAQGIEKNLKAQDGVRDIQVDLTKKEVRFQMEEGKSLSEKEIKDLISKAGLEAGNVKTK